MACFAQRSGGMPLGMWDRSRLFIDCPSMTPNTPIYFMFGLVLARAGGVLAPCPPSHQTQHICSYRCSRTWGHIADVLGAGGIDGWIYKYRQRPAKPMCRVVLCVILLLMGEGTSRSDRSREVVGVTGEQALERTCPACTSGRLADDTRQQNSSS